MSARCLFKLKENCFLNKNFTQDTQIRGYLRKPFLIIKNLDD
jgi:hypothetical protein